MSDIGVPPLPPGQTTASMYLWGYRGTVLMQAFHAIFGLGTHLRTGRQPNIFCLRRTKACALLDSFLSVWSPEGPCTTRLM